MIHRDLSENRDLRSSRNSFLLIKMFSSFVVTSIWSHQNRILIFESFDFSTISNISKYEKNHLDLNKSSRLNDRRTTQLRLGMIRFDPVPNRFLPHRIQSGSGLIFCRIGSVRFGFLLIWNRKTKNYISRYVAYIYVYMHVLYAAYARDENFFFCENYRARS
jgi:hypothetical protein